MRVKGWKEVFRFTFYQQIKTKSFIIGTVIITLIVALIAFLADLLPAVLLGDEIDKAARAATGDTDISIETVYISNETGYSLDFYDTAAELGVKLIMISADEASAKIDEISDTTEKAMVARLILDEYGFLVDSRYAGGESAVEKGDCETVNAALANALKVKYLTNIGVSSDELSLVMSDVQTTYSCAGEEPISFVKQMINSIVPMISSIILFIFIFSYSQLVAQSVAIEKSSRIIEYLLTSVKPLAIILGKVLAMCCVSLMQFIIIGLGGTLGFVLSLPFGIFTKVNLFEITEAAGSGAEAVGIVNDIGSAFSSVNASAFVIMILTFILGFLFFAGMAGLAGASISKMEDLSAAIQPLSLIGVLGFYLAYFPQVTGEENTMSVIARYIPISSPFILPSDYLLGKIGIAEALVSVAILAAADILIMMFVAKVYESIILHTGNRLKIGDMLKISK